MSCYEIFHNTYVLYMWKRLALSAVHTQLMQATTKFGEFTICARLCAMSNVHMYSFGLIWPILSHLYLDSRAGIVQLVQRQGNGFGGSGIESRENPEIFLYSKTRPGGLWGPQSLPFKSAGLLSRRLMGLGVASTIHLIQRRRQNKCTSASTPLIHLHGVDRVKFTF